MRIASSTIYSQTTFRLNRINNDMLEANTMITTGKKINSLADDPVGLSRVVSLKSSLNNIEQFQDNIATGRKWLEGGETALTTVTELITEAKTLSIQMNSGVVNSSDRRSGAQQISGYLDQILALSNTSVQGQYIFSGTKTDNMAYTMETTGSLTRAVYGGNDSPFQIKMAAFSDVVVGYDGSTVFTNDKIVIDETNNKIDFQEDPAGGSAFYGAQLTATIPNGQYTPDELAVAVGAAMTARSAATGQPEVIDVSQANANIVVNDYSVLNLPTAGTPIDVTYTAASNTWAVTNEPAYPSGVIALQLESDASKVVLDFNGDNTGDLTIHFDSPVADTYSVNFEITAAAAGGNGVTYDVSYNEGTQKYSMYQTAGPPLNSMKLMWDSGTNKDTTLGVDMGFDISSDDTGVVDGTNHTSDNEVEWGIFRTLIDLEAYLENDDIAGINRSISRLSADFNHIESYISESGIKQNRLDIRDSVIEDLKLSYESNRMQIEDADAIEVYSLLQQKQYAYQAALSSTSKIMNMSLMDYL